MMSRLAARMRNKATNMRTVIFQTNLNSPYWSRLLDNWHEIPKENDCQSCGQLNSPLHQRKQAATESPDSKQRLGSAPLSVGIPTKAATAAARRRQSKVMRWPRLEAPETPAASHASAATTNKTNKQKKVQTLNHGWTQSVSFAAPESIFGWKRRKVRHQKPKARCSAPLTLFSPMEKKTQIIFPFFTFILSFLLRKCWSCL